MAVHLSIGLAWPPAAGRNAVHAMCLQPLGVRLVYSGVGVGVVTDIPAGLLVKGLRWNRGLPHARGGDDPRGNHFKGAQLTMHAAI